MHWRQPLTIKFTLNMSKYQPNCKGDVLRKVFLLLRAFFFPGQNLEEAGNVEEKQRTLVIRGVRERKFLLQIPGASCPGSQNIAPFVRHWPRLCQATSQDSLMALLHSLLPLFYIFSTHFCKTPDSPNIYTFQSQGSPLRLRFFKLSKG